MVNYKVNTENLSLDAYKKNAYKKISSVLEDATFSVTRRKYNSKVKYERANLSYATNIHLNFFYKHFIYKH